ncbi:MAG TPA: hypothetical protein PK265_02495 [Candidatus Saccharibacteria bacterium]|nr:hypothetical protein [Candidatus Saccharibacteria bacterium]HRQ98168.1 hypothetical protein [Candidatus Saccharibacteria bacterium]
MDWLSKLKDLIKANFKNSVHVTSSKSADNNNRTQNSNNKNIITVNGNVSILNVQTDINGKLSTETLAQLREAIMPAFESGDILLLQDSAKETVVNYKNFEANEEVIELLDFFQGKIIQTDMNLLRTGLYEAYLIENDELDTAQQVKRNAVNRFGPRGKNIINLASGGYFSTHIRPLYEALSEQPGFEMSAFNKEYEQIVNELPFAIFVHNGINKEEILTQLEDKTERNIKYGVSEDTIILNGFGANADRIESLIPDLQKRFTKVAPSIQYLGNLKTIQVSVYYRERAPLKTK